MYRSGPASGSRLWTSHLGDEPPGRGEGNSPYGHSEDIASMYLQPQAFAQADRPGLSGEATLPPGLRDAERRWTAELVEEFTRDPEPRRGGGGS